MIKSKKNSLHQKTLAYVIGIAIGDGNLSNPNGRATRLRITCDTRYPYLIERICEAIRTLLPANKVSLIKRSHNYVDISCYSNHWERWLGWSVGKGSKYQQRVSVPQWILEDEEYIVPCLRGLIETDGSIYEDRGYRMVNFVTTIPRLADHVLNMLAQLGFKANKYIFHSKHKPKYTIRISRNVSSLINVLRLKKVDFSLN